jgi:hypothetical protein
VASRALVGDDPRRDGRRAGSIGPDVPREPTAATVGKHPLLKQEVTEYSIDGTTACTRRVEIVGGCRGLMYALQPLLAEKEGTEIQHPTISPPHLPSIHNRQFPLSEARHRFEMPGSSSTGHLCSAKVRARAKGATLVANLLWSLDRDLARLPTVIVGVRYLSVIAATNPLRENQNHFAAHSCIH